MQDMVINDYINHLEENKELFDLLKYQKLVGSLAIGDQFEANEIKWFLQISEGVENNAVTGSEDFPGEFLSKAPNEPSRAEFIPSSNSTRLEPMSSSWLEH